MTQHQKTKIDRSSWPPGPWDDEPEDKVEWRDTATGMPCLAVRGEFGAWCGYVGVAPGHSAYGVHCSDVDVEVHGGLTYANTCRGNICHEPRPGEPADVWWLGFDCAHSWDVVPRMLALACGSIFHDATYKRLAYVRQECARVAQQLAELGRTTLEGYRHDSDQDLPAAISSDRMPSLAAGAPHRRGPASISPELATLRASWRRELSRLGARPFEGGPHDAVRQGALLAFFDASGPVIEVSTETMSALGRLLDGCGPGPVREVVTQSTARVEP